MFFFVENERTQRYTLFCSSAGSDVYKNQRLMRIVISSLMMLWWIGKKVESKEWGKENGDEPRGNQSDPYDPEYTTCILT